MAILKEIGKFFTAPFRKAKQGIEHSQEKKKRRTKREIEKVQEAQKYGLKTEKKQYETLKDILRGEYAPEVSLKHQRKDYERALRYAGDILAPQRERMLQEAQTGYERFTRPGIVGQFTQGPQGSTAGSSALNQALAASAADLSRQVTNQYQGLQFGLAEQFLGKRDLARQQELASMMGIATGQNPIAQQVASTQVPSVPSLGSFILPAVGAVGGGLLGGPLGATAGYKIGTGLGQVF